MKNTLFYIIFLLANINLSAQSLGINTSSPGSTLSVNGSVSAMYNAVTATNYTLTANDCVVAYNGASNATFRLPAALPQGGGNFKGRIYRIKNNSDFLLSIYPAGSERIFTEVAALLKKGATLELVSTGLTSGSTWDALDGLSQDSIRLALEKVGCVSCPAYDGAAIDGWVGITPAEYTAIQSGLPGTGAYGSSASAMGIPASTTLNFVATLTQNFATMTQLPAAYYPVALSVKTGPFVPATMAGMRLLLSNTGQTSGYAYFGLATPNVSPLAAQTIYYFVLKRPTGKSLTGSPSNMAVFQSSPHQVGMREPTSTNIYYGTGTAFNYTNPGQMYFTIPQFQVLATGAKAW